MTGFGSSSLLSLPASSTHTFAVRFQVLSFVRSLLLLCKRSKPPRSRSETSFDLIQPKRDRSAGQMDS